MTENLSLKILKRIKRFLGRKVGVIYGLGKIFCARCVEGFSCISLRV
jgi:hypothetical protein